MSSSWTKKNQVSGFLEMREKHLKAMAAEHQQSAAPVNPTVMNAAYNFHIHTVVCFQQKEKHSNLGQKLTKRKDS